MRIYCMQLVAAYLGFRVCAVPFHTPNAFLWMPTLDHALYDPFLTGALAAAIAVTVVLSLAAVFGQRLDLRSFFCASAVTWGFTAYLHLLVWHFADALLPGALAALSTGLFFRAAPRRKQ